MAKKSATSPKPSKPVRISEKVMRFNLEEYLPHAEEKQASQDLYSNYVHVVASEYEVMLDFYRASRIPGITEIEVVHLQKLFLPLGVGKGLANALESTISDFEKTTGIEIINPDEGAEEE